MKKSLVVLWTALALAGLLITGCKKNDGTGPDANQAPPGVTNEQNAMQYYASNDGFVQNDEQTFDDKEIDPIDYGTFGKIDAAITPLRFGRFITSVTRTVNITVMPGDSIAIAHVHKDIIGTFKIKALNTNNDTVIIQKPFNDQSDRNVVFKRISSTDHFWARWIPVATSLVDGGTVAPNNLINLTKLQLFLPSGDTITVTDPLNYYLRFAWESRFNRFWKGVPILLAGQPIKLQATVVSSSPDTDIVALRYGFDFFHKRRARMVLVSEVNNGDGTYTRVYETSRTSPLYVHFHRGFFHMGVDAATKATLYDDTAPYAVSWWGIPYRVF